MKFKVKMKWLKLSQEWRMIENGNTLMEIPDSKKIHDKFKGLSKTRDKEYLITITPK